MAKAHIVICQKCKEKFDTNKIYAVKVSATRYGHASCYPEITELVPMERSLEDEPDYKMIIDYCYKIFGEEHNIAMTKKYIKKFVNENKYSLSGIYKALYYFYDIKHNSIDKANNSIGIVPFVYQDAYNYYYNLFMSQQNLQKTEEFKTKEKEIVIKPPKSRGLFKRLFKLQEVEDEE